MCLYRLWQHIKFGSKHNVVAIDACESLLLGDWVLKSSNNIEAFDAEALKNEVDIYTPMANILKYPEKTFVSIKLERTPNSDEIWKLSFESPAVGIVVSQFKLGEKVEELTANRLRTISIFTLPQINKLVSLRQTKNGVVVWMMREVDITDPDTLVVTLKIKQEIATITYRRIQRDKG